MGYIARQTNQLKQTQELLIRSHFVLVKKIARSLSYHLPRTILFEDLLQAGLLGLLEAIRLYDKNKGASFTTYATIRIKGQILDEARRNDWQPRSIYSQSRIIAKVTRLLENKLGREVRDQEIAQELQLDLDQYYKQKKVIQICGFDDLSTDDNLIDPKCKYNYEPLNNVMEEDLYNKLMQKINCLSEKEQLVINLYYQKELNLKQIGKYMGVSESRISQIHHQATNKLKASLNNLA